MGAGANTLRLEAWKPCGPILDAIPAELFFPHRSTVPFALPLPLWIVESSAGVARGFMDGRVTIGYQCIS